MATSLLATGVPTEEAYRLASVVQQRLLMQGFRELDAEQLVQLTHDLLLTEANDVGIADRWTAWRRAKRSGRPIAIVLGGAAGTGKSTLATRLAVRLYIPRVVTTDAILLEIGNALSRIARNEASAIIRHFQTAPEVTLVSLTPELMSAALSLYEKHQDKTWGLVDCVSFVVMQNRKITAALAFDRHFIQAGFTLAQ